MSDNFYTIVTKRGQERIATSMSGGAKVRLTHMAVGDANGAYYEPCEDQVALVNERQRVNITQVIQDGIHQNWFVAEAMLPGEIGGFYIREVGLYDSEGHLFAIGKIPETYKAVLPSGADKELHIRLIFKISNSESVQITLNPSVEVMTEETTEEAIGKAINALDWKPTVRLATTENITLTGLQTIDDMAVRAGDRVLVKDQADPKANGIYLVSENNWTRAKDCQGSISGTYGLIVTVSYGTKNTNTIWILPIDRKVNVGNDNLVFYAFKSGGSRLSLGEGLSMISIGDNYPKEALKTRFGFLSYGQKKNQDTFWRQLKTWGSRSSLLLFDHLGQLANYFSEHTDTETEIPANTWQATGPTEDAHLITRDYLDLRLIGTTTGGIGSFTVHPEGIQPANTIRLTSTLQKIKYTDYPALCDVIGEKYGAKVNEQEQYIIKQGYWETYVVTAGYYKQHICGDFYVHASSLASGPYINCEHINNQPLTGQRWTPDPDYPDWNQYYQVDSTSGWRKASGRCDTSWVPAITDQRWIPAQYGTRNILYYMIPTILIAYGGSLPAGMAISIVAR